MRERKTGKDNICKHKLCKLDDGALVCVAEYMVDCNTLSYVLRPKCVDCKYRVEQSSSLDNINLEEIEDEKDN